MTCVSMAESERRGVMRRVVGFMVSTAVESCGGVILGISLMESDTGIVSNSGDSIKGVPMMESEIMARVSGGDIIVSNTIGMVSTMRMGSMIVSPDCGSNLCVSFST